MSGTAWVAVAIFAVVYVLIATEWVHRVRAAVGGACAMLVVGITDAHDAFFAEESAIDWNVIFLLLGMMLIVSVLMRTGIFEYLAVWAAKRARGRPFRVMVILVLITATASAALDNVTTVLLIAPVTFLVCERIGVTPMPFLLAEVFASNIGGTATLVGDPPNIIIASRGDLGFNDFLIHLAPFVIVLLAVFIGLCRIMFRSAFVYDPDRAAAVMTLNERDAIRDHRLLAVSLTVLAVVLSAFVLHTALHLEPAVVALVGGIVLLALSRLDPTDVASDVEWPTLIFFAGLFVMVGGLVTTGVLDEIATAAIDATDNRLLLAATVLLLGSAVASGVVDNIPFVAAMSPVVAQMVTANSASGNADSLWWALALGADLGGNATAVGAAANVVVLGIAEKAGHKISFWQFTRYGLVVAAASIALALPYLWLRYFAIT